MNIEVNIIVKINNLNLSYMIALNTCIGMSKILSLLKFLGQGKIKSTFQNIKEKCNIAFSMQVQNCHDFKFFLKKTT